MFTTLKALLFSAVVALGLAGGATSAAAEQVVFEQIPAEGDIDHAAPGGTLVRIEISAPKTITAIAQRVKFNSANEVRFVVHRLDGATWVPIVETAPQPQAAQAYAYVRSPDFPAITLQAGQTYAIGLLSRDGDQAVELGAALPSAPVDGVKVTGRIIYHEYAATTPAATSALAYSLKLFGPDAAAVPTLSEWGLILMGLMLAGGAAVWLQRRQTA